MVKALRKAVPGLVVEIPPTTLRSPHSRSTSLALAAASIINALADLPRDVTLILDDYHVIAEPAIHESVAFLLDHLPKRLHLVVSSRAEPPA